MSWWGKLLGGSFGYALGGPLGAVLGAALGHKFDKGLENIDAFSAKERITDDTEVVQSAFFTATFSVMGHIAKSDGRVSESEIQLARQVMLQMQLNEEQKQLAMRLFNEGKSDEFPLDDILQQFKKQSHHRRNLLQMFLEIQIATVLADGKVHGSERQLLIHIGGALGFPKSSIERLIHMVEAQQQFAGETDGKPKVSLSDAYTVLGIDKSASDTDIKKAYRRLMNQHHPDKLVSKGLPEEMMKLASEKTHEIKMAYEQIKSARNL